MLQPYITFQGNALEAINYYEKVLKGTNKEVSLWGNMGKQTGMPISEKMADKVLYGKLTVCGVDINFSDTDPNFHEPQVFAPSCFISLAIRFKSQDELRVAYDELLTDGTVLMEIGEQFFAKLYAWVQDKYGVTWQLICD